MTEAWGLLEKASERAHFQAESVGICLGHMMNAIIDLESGETKATAIKTLQRGIALIEKRNAPARASRRDSDGSGEADETVKHGSMRSTTARAEGIAQKEVAMTTANNPVVTADAERLMREFYVSSAYDPKARPADNVKAAIQFAMTQASPPPDEMVERAAMAMCAKVEADAVAGLRYIERHYGRLDGVGWDRVFDAHDELFRLAALKSIGIEDQG